jgi:hypothetical protein
MTVLAPVCRDAVKASPGLDCLPGELCRRRPMSAFIDVLMLIVRSSCCRSMIGCSRVAAFQRSSDSRSLAATLYLLRSLSKGHYLSSQVVSA